MEMLCKCFIGNRYSFVTRLHVFTTRKDGVPMCQPASPSVVECLMFCLEKGH